MVKFNLIVGQLILSAKILQSIIISFNFFKFIASFLFQFIDLDNWKERNLSIRRAG
jgi:hypothetical protein